MIVIFHKNFEKEYKKQPQKIREAFKVRLQVLHHDEFDPTLNNHPLQGTYGGYRSINVSGNIRALYKRQDFQHIVFTNIGSHSYLYK